MSKFSFVTDAQPHKERRRQLLEEYPEIKSLFGFSYKTAVIGILATVCQLATAVLVSSSGCSTLSYLAIAYAVGGTFAQIIGIVIHECCHSLVAESADANHLIGVLVNVGIAFPLAEPFKKHHQHHHVFLGVHGLDPDLPMEIEFRLAGSGVLSRFAWVALTPLFYCARGLALKRRLWRTEVFNLLTLCLSNFLIWKYLGWSAIKYLVLSFWFGYSLHPAAAHFIQEHYVFQPGQETYSYYGWMNSVFLNIGYHNEHHDFPEIPCWNLPKLFQIAETRYAALKGHYSWIQILGQVIWTGQVGPWSRIVRTIEGHKLHQQRLFASGK